MLNLLKSNFRVMKKVKRISLIVRCKEVLSEMLGIKERKIKRSLQSANDRAIEEALTARERIPALLNKLGECETQAAINDVINDICDTLDQIDAWEKKQKQVERIQDILDEEVDFQED